MDNTLTVAELKRRGMAAIEDRLKHGPIRILKRNRAAAVVLSEARYEQLLAAGKPPLKGLTAVDWLKARAGSGTLAKRQIDRRLRAERNG